MLGLVGEVMELRSVSVGPGSARSTSMGGVSYTRSISMFPSVMPDLPRI
jgi:hypothetical protein